MNPKKNTVASVKSKLLHIARSTGKNHQLLLLRYFQERFLHRLSKSAYQDNFCLKGAAFLYALQQEKSRMTKDIDFLGLGVPSNHSGLRKIVAEICTIEYAEDGVLFDLDSLALEDIIKDGNYQGVRVHLTGYLDRTKQRMQIDIGLDDVVLPAPQAMIYPVILDMEAPNLLAYSVESVIAEKFEAMIDLAEANTRMKDFYDVYHLLANQPINYEILEKAIQETFKQRGTAILPNHSLFEPDFQRNPVRIERWKAWLRKTKLSPDLAYKTVMQKIMAELKPIYLRLAQKQG